MIIHICTDELLIIEATVEETPDDGSVSSMVYKVLEENEIFSWHSLEISQFSIHGKRLIMTIPVRVLIPQFIANFNGEIS